MTDQYTSELEKQNEELRQKLAATQKELEEAKAKLSKWNSGYNTALNDLVSVQPMTEPVGMSHFISGPQWTADKPVKNP